MPPDPTKNKSFRQPCITSFFARKTEPTLPPAKQIAGSSKRNGQVESVPWEELDKRHRESLQIDKASSSALAPSASAFTIAPSTSKIPPTNGVKPLEVNSEIIDKTDNMDLSWMDDDDFGLDESTSSCKTPSDETNGVVDKEQASLSNGKPTACFPDYSGASLDCLVRVLSAPNLPPLVASPSHAVLCNETGSAFVDRWDEDHVHMPCSGHLRQAVSSQHPEQGFITRWEVIRNSITRNYSSALDFGAAKAVYTSPTPFNPEMVAGLTKFIEKLSSSEASFLLQHLFPFIAGLVIDLPFVCSQPIPLLKCGMNRSITLSQKQISHLLAAAFFCTFPKRKDITDHEPSYPYINFDALFRLPKEWKMKRSNAKLEKLKCILSYFHQVKAACPVGNVTFARRSLSKFPDWNDCTAHLSKIQITHKGTIEDEGNGCLQADFANKFVGGGVLNEGCVQEEIRFVINPELIVSRLFTQALLPNEVLVITGAERFSDYSGYGDSFVFTGPRADSTPRDCCGRRLTQIVAMDALRFGKAEEQYQPENLVRELNKAFVAFSHDGTENPARCVATGNWGCGAFRGEPRLKFVLQLLACSANQRDLVYFTFGDPKLHEELYSIYATLLDANATVGNVFRILNLYYEDIVSKRKTKSMPLCKFLSNCFRG